MVTVSTLGALSVMLGHIDEMEEYEDIEETNKTVAEKSRIFVATVKLEVICW